MAEKTRSERFLIYVLPWFIFPWVLALNTILTGVVALYNLVSNFFKPKNSPELHAKKVQFVQKQVNDWSANGRKTKLCHARPAWKTMNNRAPIYKITMTGIHIDMDDIIYIDTVRKVVNVEPLMTMGKLTKILIPMGWTILVVPEFDDLTVGGLVCGAGLETSSHKYGLFQHTCVSYEIVLASGEVVKCTKNEHADLFYAIPWSCGTLGFLTSIELAIIPATKYVKLEYIPVHSLQEAVSTFESQVLRESGNDFVEGIMFSLEKGVIMVGQMTEVAEIQKINSVRRWYKPLFYKHVETFLKENPAPEYIEYIPLKQYFHRHTRSLFWITDKLVPCANSLAFRYILGWTLPFKISWLRYFKPNNSLITRIEKYYVVHDFVVPLQKLKESLLLSHQETQVYPIWLCPTKIINVPGAIKVQGEDKMYVDFGMYGLTESTTFELVKSTRIFENFCLDNLGFQGLYSEVCMTRDEFEQMFDHMLYLKVREELNCSDAFSDVYDKVSMEARPVHFLS